MDAAIGFLFAMVVLAGVIFALAIAFKNRNAIKRWLNTPYYAEDDRRLRLHRRMEDAQKELEELDKAEPED